MHLLLLTQGSSQSEQPWAVGLNPVRGCREMWAKSRAQAPGSGVDAAQSPGGAKTVLETAAAPLGLCHLFARRSPDLRPGLHASATLFEPEPQSRRPWLTELVRPASTPPPAAHHVGLISPQTQLPPPDIRHSNSAHGANWAQNFESYFKVRGHFEAPRPGISWRNGFQGRNGRKGTRVAKAVCSRFPIS